MCSTRRQRQSVCCSDAARDPKDGTKSLQKKQKFSSQGRRAAAPAQEEYLSTRLTSHQHPGFKPDGRLGIAQHFSSAPGPPPGDDQLLAVVGAPSAAWDGARRHGQSPFPGRRQAGPDHVVDVPPRTVRINNCPQSSSRHASARLAITARATQHLSMLTTGTTAAVLWISSRPVSSLGGWAESRAEGRGQRHSQRHLRGERPDKHPPRPQTQRGRLAGAKPQACFCSRPTVPEGPWLGHLTRKKRAFREALRRNMSARGRFSGSSPSSSLCPPVRTRQICTGAEKLAKGNDCIPPAAADRQELQPGNVGYLIPCIDTLACRERYMTSCTTSVDSCSHGLAPVRSLRRYRAQSAGRPIQRCERKKTAQANHQFSQSTCIPGLILPLLPSRDSTSPSITSVQLQMQMRLQLQLRMQRRRVPRSILYRGWFALALQPAHRLLESHAPRKTSTTWRPAIERRECPGPSPVCRYQTGLPRRLPAPSSSAAPQISILLTEPSNPKTSIPATLRPSEMVDFTLSATELAVRTTARRFAATHLTGAKQTYSALHSHVERFQATQALYAHAVAAGLVRGQIPAPLGGTNSSLLAAAILAEELTSVERGLSLTLLGTGLGLTPLCLAFEPRFEAFLSPFLCGEGSPLASLVFSEPGGVANWLERGAPGLQTTAYLDGDTWVLDGEKTWATNSAGWDFRGAELQCVVCRCTNPGIPVSAPPEARIMILLVTRDDVARNAAPAFEVLKHQQVAGWTAVSGPHIRYSGLRVPARNLLSAPGKGAAVVEMSFEMSACLVGAMATGVQRAIFDAALAFAKGTRGGSVPIGERQSVADLLIDIKMRTETSRYLTWKAATKLHSDLPNYHDCREPALEAKVYCSDAAVKSAVDAINLVGVSAYDLASPFTELLNDAMVLPIFDGGNVGVRRRALQKLFMGEGYEPWET
ncbi:unnamed protein product [Diplocarpon coronariae]